MISHLRSKGMQIPALSQYQAALPALVGAGCDALTMLGSSPFNVV